MIVGGLNLTSDVLLDRFGETDSRNPEDMTHRGQAVLDADGQFKVVVSEQNPHVYSWQTVTMVRFGLSALRLLTVAQGVGQASTEKEVHQRKAPANSRVLSLGLREAELEDTQPWPRSQQI